MSVRVSVIVPSSNPGKCIRGCIASLQKQTLKNIEIICVDAGSKDGTADYLAEISEKLSGSSSPDITVLTRLDASFGELVNAGIEAASGRYIAIVRAGDRAEPDMLKSLYEVSSGMDMVMGSYYLTPSKGAEEILYRLPARYTAISSFNPLLTFDTSLDQSEIFSLNCAAGAAIISRELLDKKSIYFTEPEGSPYHDISFSFKVWACASNVRLLNSAMLHCSWRGSSSATSDADMLFEEFREIRYFIREAFAEEPDRIKVLSGIMMRLKYDSCLDCCQTLKNSDVREFARRASLEFQEDVGRGYVVQKYFPSFDWNTFSTWVYDPESFADMIDRSRRPSLLSRIRKKIKG